MKLKIISPKKPNTKISCIVNVLRKYRKYHRYLGLLLIPVIVISSVSGILLSWKKDINLLQPTTNIGIETDLSQWISLSEMSIIALSALDSAHNLTDNAIDRIEARPDKGIVKLLFQSGYWEVQLDGKTGKVYSVARRHSDWIEKLHDGSIISNTFKLFSMNILGIGLIVLTVTGSILWFFPKLIKKMKIT